MWNKLANSLCSYLIHWFTHICFLTCFRSPCLGRFICLRIRDLRRPSWDNLDHRTRITWRNPNSPIKTVFFHPCREFGVCCFFLTLLLPSFFAHCKLNSPFPSYMNNSPGYCLSLLWIQLFHTLLMVPYTVFTSLDSANNHFVLFHSYTTYIFL